MIVDGPLRTFFDKFSFTGDCLDAAVKSWNYAVAAGEIPNTTTLTLSARNLTSPTADMNPLWGGAINYPWPVADQTPKIVSSDADDDGAPAGNGAQTVRITWLNAAGTQATEDVVLDGVNNVDMVANTVRRINRIEVLTVGTTGYNEGTLTLYATDGATVLGLVPIGVGASFGTVQTVPAGYRDVITHISITQEAPAALNYPMVAVMYRPSGGQFTVWSGIKAWRSGLYRLPFPAVLSAGTDYFIGKSGVNTGVFDVVASGWRETA